MFYPGLLLYSLGDHRLYQQEFSSVYPHHDVGHGVLDILATGELILEESRHVLNLGVGGHVLGTYCQVSQHHLYRNDS